MLARPQSLRHGEGPAPETMELEPDLFLIFFYRWVWACNLFVAEGLLTIVRFVGGLREGVWIRILNHTCAIERYPSPLGCK